MLIVAILAIRNEEGYLPNCLTYLMRNGISFAVIDNGSTDSSQSIVHRNEFRSGLVKYELLPFCGDFDWEAILAAKARVAETLDADWVIHHDCDEMMHSYREAETLADSIKRLDQAGYNAVNFDEFVFLPVDSAFVPESAGFPDIRSYYFYQPRNFRLARAWKPEAKLSNLASGGHRLTGENLRLAPESLALRHYLFRDQPHAFEKYTSRSFKPAEIERGWHRNRHNKPREQFKFPAHGQLEWLDSAQSRQLSRSRPRGAHFWEW
jgi:glycosyltransferase involved in cell wall biosynthesis